VKRGVEERGAEQGFDLSEGFGGWQVFSNVARGVAPHESRLWSSLERDGADEKVAQGGIGAAVLTEGEFLEGAIGNGGPSRARKRSRAVGVGGASCGGERVDQVSVRP